MSLPTPTPSAYTPAILARLHPSTHARPPMLASFFLSALAAILLCIPLSTHAQAQTGTAVVELADRPIVRESLGLRLYLPVGAEAQTYELGDRTSLAIMLPNGLGVINIQDSAASPEATLPGISEGIIRNRLGIEAPRQLPKPGQKMGRGALLIHQPNLTMGKASGPQYTAERIYLAIEDAPGSASLMGYTVFKPSPTRALTFELITDQQNYLKAREMYELTVAAATIEDPGALADARRIGIETGARWLQDVNQEQLTAAIRAVGEDWRWERLFRPNLAGGGDDAAEEIGYRRTRAWLGRRGEVTRSDSTRRGGIDDQQGFLLRMESRMLHQNLIIDTAAVFFLSLDKQEESWSIEMAIRDQQSGSLQRSTEFGIRDGSSLTVSTRLGNEPLSTSRPDDLSDGYISRLETYLLPWLLVQTELPTEYRFYAFQSQSGRVQMRTDLLERNTQGAGAWRLTTRLSQDDEPQVSTLNADGTPLGTKLNDGSVWQPIELARLGRLWRSKRLPMN